MQRPPVQRLDNPVRFSARISASFSSRFGGPNNKTALLGDEAAAAAWSRIGGQSRPPAIRDPRHGASKATIVMPRTTRRSRWRASNRVGPSSAHATPSNSPWLTSQTTRKRAGLSTTSLTMTRTPIRQGTTRMKVHAPSIKAPLDANPSYLWGARPDRRIAPLKICAHIKVIG